MRVSRGIGSREEEAAAGGETHSGKISDVRKSLAGGKEGRMGLVLSCVSVLTDTATSVPRRGRRASDRLLRA